MFRNPSRQALTAALIVAALSTGSCVSSDAVQNFTDAAAKASAQFPSLVQDMRDSCIRKQMADRPVDEIEDVRGRAESACKEFSDLQPNLQGALTVLVNYLTALNELASDKVISYDSQIDDIAGKIQTVGGFSDAHVAAVKGLAKFLFDNVARGYRRSHLASAMKSTNDDLSTLINGLSRIVDTDYLRELSVEESSLRERYRQAIQEDKTQSRTLQLVIQDRWRQDLESLAKKRDAARDFQQILAKIYNGHAELAAYAGNWEAKEVSANLTANTAAIARLITDFKTAF